MAEWLILHTLTVAALALLALGCGRLLRLRPAARHALWLVVLLKLLTPPLVYWPWTLPAPAENQSIAIAKQDNATATVEASAPSATPPIQSSDQLWEVWEAAVAEPAPRPDDFASTIAVWRPTDLAAALWISGGLAIALVQVARVLRCRRLLSRGAMPPARLVETVAELAADMGMKSPSVLVLNDIHSPMVWGFGRPRLLWPAGLEERLPAAGVRAVLAHELAHIRRRDHLVGWLLLAGACVWWWHPLWHLARRRLGREAERACDAWVIQLLPQARRSYAEALLAVAAHSAKVVVPALGAAAGRADLERRLTMIMRERMPCRLPARWVVGVGVLALAALPTWTLGQEVLKPAAPQPKPQAKAETVADGLSIVLTQADPATKPAPTDREKRLQDLESKLQVILKELQDLRGKPMPAFTARVAAPVTVPPGYVATPVTVPPGVAHVTGDNAPTVVADVIAVPAHYYGITTARAAASDPSTIITLTRTTYRLPAGKAEALGAFLKEHVKTSVLETKVEGDTLVVTTAPDAQQAIAGLVALIRGKAASAATTGTIHWTPNAPSSAPPNPRP